ncbi:MAG: 16S rRNA (cytidine(1402)-2'-O)-methyltransferase [Synechococcaceae cyanobacterium SM2_3_60]|nr:16S rRNA (cytidine(1402)-2'-O)-methyltransferase [Synechococcaceae cyanobacterium SM2_3_60]
MTPETLAGLYLVPTPIGNREDITLRSLRVLREVDLIAAEDTRHSGQLLAFYEITTPLISFHEHNRAQRIPQLVAKLQAGLAMVSDRPTAIAIITDAGTPGISDPGQDLVRACIEAAIPVTPLPGATACIPALVASGLPTDRFVFEGFLGRQSKQRLAELAQEPRTIILYEAPHRLRKTLLALQEALGRDREICLVRELSKRYEEFWRGTLAAACTHAETVAPRGEFCLVIAGYTAPPVVLDEAAISQALQNLIASGVSPSQASRQLAQTHGLSRRQVYQIALAIANPLE